MLQRAGTLENTRCSSVRTLCWPVVENHYSLDVVENIAISEAIAAPIPMALCSVPPPLTKRSVILIAMGFASFAIATSSAHALRETDIETTDRLVFESTITEFRRARASKTPVTLD